MVTGWTGTGFRCYDGVGRRGSRLCLTRPNSKMSKSANTLLDQIKERIPRTLGSGRRLSAQQQTALRALALLLFVAITVTLIVMRDRLEELAEWGYAGAFVVNLASSATIVLPAPGLAVTFALGGALPSPLLVGLASGLGATLGELTGYLAGYSGRAIVEDRERYQRMSTAMQRSGPAIIFLLAALPIPAFDLAGIAAGTLKMPVRTFLLACWPGKTLKTTLVAFAGAGMLPRLTAWIVEFLR